MRDVPEGRAYGDLYSGTTLSDLRFETWADPCPPFRGQTVHFAKVKNDRPNCLLEVRVVSECRFGEARFLAKDGKTYKEIIWKGTNVRTKFKKKGSITVMDATEAYDEIWTYLFVKDETQLEWPGYAAGQDERINQPLRYKLPLR